tara:strand:+ start:484 stop:843 length:360 start_codon:yes stop_codon:yes gene_type:complete
MSQTVSNDYILSVRGGDRLVVDAREYQAITLSLVAYVDKNEALEKENALLKKEIKKRERVEKAMMDIVRQKGKYGVCDLLLPIHYREGEWADTEDTGLEWDTDDVDTEDTANDGWADDV